MINRGICLHGVLTWILDHHNAVTDCPQIITTASPVRLLVNANAAKLKARLFTASMTGRNRTGHWTVISRVPEAQRMQRQAAAAATHLSAQTHPRQKKKRVSSASDALLKPTLQPAPHPRQRGTWPLDPTPAPAAPVALRPHTIWTPALLPHRVYCARHPCRWRKSSLPPTGV